MMRAAARRRGIAGVLAAVAAIGLAGCAATHDLRHHADRVCARLEAAHVAAAAPGARPAARTPDLAGDERTVLFFAPREGAADPATPADAPPPAGAPGAAAVPAGKASTAAPDSSAAVPAGETPAPDFGPLPGDSLGQVVKADLRDLPRNVAGGMKHAFVNPTNLAVLGAAFGLDRITRHNLDRDIRDRIRDDDTSLAETGDFGSVIGNPALHFGIAAAWYGAAVQKRDARNYAFSKTLFEALLVNNLTTLLLKVSMNDRSPNGEYYGWPSGHTSSSVCFASVLHEYYGWKAGVPLYLLAGYTAATRLQDREHDLSDLVFGAALGWVVGHSVVKGELPQVAGFQVLPYTRGDAAGLMFVKQW